ncbi:helix-turn-helix transcriptional regulator|uniref:Helix-turn-helix domain-containing protein n=1 Tax=Dendrosporobacter quercicolus TaxID=146817 RepID=A0A1G9NPU5_9FIRM|nr:helix-turn-helix transcriptional regulator [Dendrosporobacter quercicolus]NSL47417.1 helix-turn-helix transcriptional regulator [Dendrosporobacter quercicolus DSM 1736]SDL88606.1 Helix-turn-helix domain-containing protein [Dendrosporobacter quercicolus]
MNIDYIAIGQRIKRIRKKRFTQEKLAEKLDVTPVYISQVENGKTKINLEMLVRIAGLLDTDPGYFINGASYQTQDYLKSDLANLLRDCPPERLQLIYNVVKLIANHGELPAVTKR